MKTLDALITVYSHLYCSNMIINRILGFLRFFIRWFANRFVFFLLKNDGKKVKYDGRPIVVSLTSFPARIGNVWIVIRCLLNQTVKPKKILLWLSKDQFPDLKYVPNSLRVLQDDIFEICFVDGDLKSYKKFFYVFENYENDYVVTVDDDIFYPSTMLESMLRKAKNDEIVVCRHGVNMRYKNGKLLPYSDWNQKKDGVEGSFFFGSGGGTMFLPSKLYKDVLDEKLFLLLAPKADDVWLNAMVRLSKLKIVNIPSGAILPVINKRNVTLCSENVGENLNDAQLRNVSEYYLKNIKIDPFAR